jgi:hypothetical protein
MNGRMLKGMIIGFFVSILVASAVFLYRRIDKPKEALGFLLPAGYQPFDWPRDYGRLPLPGSLVQITVDKGFRYLLPLKDCGIDPIALIPEPGYIALPSIKFDSRRSAEVLSALQKVLNLGASGATARTIEIELGAVSDEMIVPAAVIANALEKAETVKQKCGKYLEAKNVYWINNALKSEYFHLTFRNTEEEAIKVSADNLSSYIGSVTADVHVKALTDGRVRVGIPLYIGFRDAASSELLTGEVHRYSLPEEQQPQLMEIGDDVYARWRSRQEHTQ